MRLRCVEAALLLWNNPETWSSPSRDILGISVGILRRSCLNFGA